MVTYHEYIVKRKKKPLDYLICFGSPFAALIVAYLLGGIIMTFLPILAFLVTPVWAACIWLCYKFITGTNQEYEYLLTDCDLDVDKIINKNRRKRIISTYRKEIVAMAPIGSSNLPSGWENLPKVEVCSDIKDEGVYVLIVSQDTQKAIYFQPTEKMIDTMVMRNPRKVFKD